MRNVSLTRIAERPTAAIVGDDYFLSDFVIRLNGTEERYIWSKYDDRSEGPREYHHIVLSDGEPVSEWYKTDD